MQKSYIFIINILKILDKIAYSLLIFGVITGFIAFLPFDLFSLLISNKYV